MLFNVLHALKNHFFVFNMAYMPSLSCGHSEGMTRLTPHLSIQFPKYLSH